MLKNNCSGNNLEWENMEREVQPRTSYESLVEKEWQLEQSMALDGEKGTSPRFYRDKIHLTP